MDRVDTDVLVIGGGGAAGRAAVEARKAGAEVILITRSDIGKGGATAHRVSETGGYNVPDGVMDPGDGPEEFYGDIIHNARGMSDPRLARLVAYEANDSLRYLESIGVQFDRKDDRYLVVQGCFASRPRMHILSGHGHPIIVALKREIERLEIPVLTGLFVTDLIVDDGICKGAVALDREGKSWVIRAKAVVIGAGGTGNLFRDTLFPTDIAGSSYGLGYRANARLTNMEFMQFGFGVVSPRRFTFRFWLWNLLPEVYNARGERFLSRYLPDGISEDDVKRARALHAPFTSADASRYLDVAAKKEIQAGRGTQAGGIFVDLTQVWKNLELMPGDFRHIFETTRNTLLKRHVDISTAPVEVGPFSHATNGGLTIDEHGQTTVVGLYAAGEAAAGPHGADRLGGNMLLTSQVFGRRAGEHAAQAAMAMDGRPLANGALEKRALSDLEDQKRGQGSIRAETALRHLRQAMWEEILVVRSAESIERARQKVTRIRQQSLPNLSIRSAKDVWGRLQLRDLLDVSEMMIAAVDMRQESRGGHFREDYPEQDDANWEVNLIIERGADGPVIRKGRLCDDEALRSGNAGKGNQS